MILTELELDAVECHVRTLGFASMNTYRLILSLALQRTVTIDDAFDAITRLNKRVYYRYPDVLDPPAVVAPRSMVSRAWRACKEVGSILVPKVKYMRVAADWFVDLCKGSETRRARPIAHALPSDARFVDAKITEGGSLILVIESASYPELEPGAMMSEHPATEFQVERSPGSSEVSEAISSIAAMAVRYSSIGQPELATELHQLAQRMGRGRIVH